MRRLVALFAALLLGLVATCLHPVPFAAADGYGYDVAAHTYDGPSVARIDNRDAEATDGASKLRRNAQDQAASPSVEARRTSTTPSATFIATEAGETYYRTMSDAHFAELQWTGRVPATGETFISPTKEFSSAYDGTLVEFNVQPGTTDSLVGVGVRDGSAATANAYPGMPGVSSGWSSTSAFFKAEGAQINIGLGRGSGLDIFNDGIISFRNVPR